MTALFWSVAVALVFLLALAVQMRVMIAVVLRRALIAWDSRLDDGKAGAAIVQAANDRHTAQAPQSEDAITSAQAYLAENYPRPLAHLRIARRACLLLPALLLLLVIVRRLLPVQMGLA